MTILCLASYAAHRLHADYAGLLVSLARQAHPDASAYNVPEVFWRLDQERHVGLIVRQYET